MILIGPYVGFHGVAPDNDEELTLGSESVPSDSSEDSDGEFVFALAEADREQG